MRQTCSVTVMFMGAICFFAAGSLMAEDDADYFLLPETPPTIERTKRPPLDRPVLKRQNFITDTDIVPPPFLLENNFLPFVRQEYPISLSLGRGSYSTSYADFIYASKTGAELTYHMFDSLGEFANLRREEHRLTARDERWVSPTVQLDALADFTQNTIWTQRHSLCRFDTGAGWYAWENMNIKARVRGAAGEIDGVESDTSWYGDLSATVQPGERQNVRILITSHNDSAFENDPAYTASTVKYDILPAHWCTVSAGGSYQKNTLFPYGGVTFRLLPRLTFGIDYEPGYDRPEWPRLYINDYVERTTPSLLMPESTFLLQERLAFYWGEYSYCSLKFRQGRWKNYMYWAAVQGTDYIAPANAADAYVSSMELDFRHTGDLLAPSLGVQVNSNTDMPFVPEYTVSAGLAARYKTWTTAFTYRYIPEMYFSTVSTGRLPAAGNLALSVAKEITPGIECAVSGDNLLGEKIESQPGIYLTSPAVYAGLNLKF